VNGQNKNILKELGDNIMKTLPKHLPEGDEHPMKTQSSILKFAFRFLAIIAMTSVAPQLMARTVQLPPGSVNGLGAAVVSAGPGGRVIVQSGLHTESGTVVVSIPVSIFGEPGAIIESGTSPGAIYPIQIDAVIHIKNTHDVNVRGITFRPLTGGTGNTAVLIEHSSRVDVIGNVTSEFQFGVIVDYGENHAICDNTITSTTRWQLDPSDPNFLPETDGIVVMNGRFARVERNEIFTALFGTMSCTDTGRITRNSASGCFIGFAFCKVPDGSYVISGNTEGGHPGGTHWTIENNVATNNSWGFLFTDGANHNMAVDNVGGGNSVYDLELAGDTDRFGFPTPASFSDVVIARSHLVVKDCGNNDIIRGNVTLIDTNVDPCF
jgi:hypothetical protein